MINFSKFYLPLVFLFYTLATTITITIGGDTMLKTNYVLGYCLFISSIFYTTLSAQNSPHWLDFFQEKIEIFLSPGHAKVYGDYYFRNLTQGAISTKIAYPFPVDNKHQYPDSIVIEDIDFEELSDAVHFTMQFNANEMKNFRVIYTQDLSTNEFRYILMTTHSWSNAIQKAEFIVHTPKAWQCHFTIQSDSIQLKGEENIYYMTRKNFLPKDDFIIQWKDTPGRR